MIIIYLSLFISLTLFDALTELRSVSMHPPFKIQWLIYVVFGVFKYMLKRKQFDSFMLESDYNTITCLI